MWNHKLRVEYDFDLQPTASKGCIFLPFFLHFREFLHFRAILCLYALF